MRENSGKESEYAEVEYFHVFDQHDESHHKHLLEKQTGSEYSFNYKCSRVMEIIIFAPLRQKIIRYYIRM